MQLKKSLFSGVLKENGVKNVDANGADDASVTNYTTGKIFIEYAQY